MCLDDHRHEHIRSVLKAEIGDALRVGLLDGLRGSGTVVKLSDEHTHLQVDLVDPPLPRHPCDLILALPARKCCAGYSVRQLKWGSLTFT